MSPLIVTTLNGVVTSSGRDVRGVPMVIQQQTLVADLTPAELIISTSLIG